MRVIAGLLLLAAAPILAQMPPPPPGPAAGAVPDGPPPPGPPHERYVSQVFISPMGEPFRAAEGEPYPVAAWFAQADTNHDGQLTRSEFRADAMRFFKLLDVNHDGIIDSHEIDRYENEVAPEVQSGWAGNDSGEGPKGGGSGGGHHGHRGGGGGGGYGSGGGGRGGGMGDGPSDTNGGDEGDSSTSSPRPVRELPRGAGRFGLINSPEPVVAADVQLTRRITPEEFAAAANRRFDLLDPDEKGVLTLDTLPHTPAQDRGGGERRHRRSH